ncbi:MAG: MaoC family dehydratase [Rhizobiales bacterium]|nr:MaoC family dehydratase [Hyphomicrobiales bacterium]
MEFGPRLVTREEIIEFASQFDPQPMHLTDEGAKATMLGTLGASGWHTCAVMMRMACDGIVLKMASMGAPGIDEVKWMKPMRPDDQLTLRITVRETRASRSRPQMGFVVLFQELFNQRRECIATLQTPLMVGRRSAATAQAGG